VDRAASRPCRYQLGATCTCRFCPPNKDSADWIEILSEEWIGFARPPFRIEGISQRADVSTLLGNGKVWHADWAKMIDLKSGAIMWTILTVGQIISELHS
jgi:hypothetical protein